HFIFIMCVLDTELRQHRIQPGSVGVHINHVRRHVSAPPLQFFNLRRVRIQDLLGRRILRQIRGRFPALVLNADSGKVIAHLILLAERSLFIRNSQHRHGNFSRSSGSRLTRSAPPRNAPELPSKTPESPHAAWLPPSLLPKYKAHALAKGIHEWRASPPAFSKRGWPVPPFPACFPGSAATRGAR